MKKSAACGVSEVVAEIAYSKATASNEAAGNVENIQLYGR